MEYLKMEDEIKYCSKRYELQRNIEDKFLEEGYFYIELSAFEDLNKFTSLYKKAKKDSLVKLLREDSEVLILRPDNTTSIIKNFIPRWQEDISLKLFYNSTVFRNNPNSNISEIRQLGVEYLGGNILAVDKEVIGMTLDVLNRFNNDFILELSNTKYISGLLEEIDIRDSQKQKLKDFIYYKNKYELLEYIKKLNIPKDICHCLFNILDFQGEILEVIDMAENYYTNNIMDEALAELRILGDFIEKENYSKYVHFDLSMIMELDYYDGVIFKGYYPNSFEEIICGGRYDSFTEEFGQRVPAVGFSLNLDELTKVYLEKDGE